MKKAFIAILLLAILGLTARTWLPGIGEFLLVKDDLCKTDCAVLLGGEPFYRIQKAVDLYNQGFVKSIIVSECPERGEELRDYYFFENRVYDVKGLETMKFSEYLLKAFAYFGKDSQNIVFTGLEATSTFDEAVAAKKTMLAKGYKSMLLVTSTYHMRRALIIFRLVFHGSGITIHPVTAKNPLYVPEMWWRKERDVRRVGEEYVSLVFNLLYHFVFNKQRTSFDSL